ncbi:hypothetical protein D9M70_473270 [compost metagenome]
MFGEFREVEVRCLGADGDIDLALGNHVIADLVVGAAAHALPFEVLPWVDVMHIGTIQQQIGDGDVP